MDGVERPKAERSQRLRESVADRQRALLEATAVSAAIAAYALLILLDGPIRAHPDQSFVAIFLLAFAVVLEFRVIQLWIRAKRDPTLVTDPPSTSRAELRRSLRFSGATRNPGQRLALCALCLFLGGWYIYSNLTNSSVAQIAFACVLIGGGIQIGVSTTLRIYRSRHQS